MRILVFGGSFDPPHRGHAALLEAAAKTVRPDLLLLVPAFQAPLKGSPQASARDRLAMVREGLLERLAAPWRRKAAVDASELNSRRKVYTVETLRRLRARHPGAELHVAVGSDSAASFPSWKEPGALRSLARWWTARRPGARARVPPFFSRIPGRMPDISSTELRRRLALGEDCADWLLAPVRARVARRGLYGRGLAAALKASLSAERYRHSIAVALAAERLAGRWGVAPERARLAGLLHDLGRSVPVERMGAYARARRLKVPDLAGIVAHQPLLAHAYISEDLARRRFGVSDRGVLSAVRRHTLGDRSMSRLDKVLFVADAVSEDRDYPGIEALRTLALADLDEAFAACARQKVEHALARGSWLHPLALSLWNSRLG